MYLANVV